MHHLSFQSIDQLIHTPSIIHSSFYPSIIYRPIHRPIHHHPSKLPQSSTNTIRPFTSQQSIHLSPNLPFLPRSHMLNTLFKFEFQFEPASFNVSSPAQRHQKALSIILLAHFSFFSLQTSQRVINQWSEPRMCSAFLLPQLFTAPRGIHFAHAHIRFLGFFRQ